MRIYNIKVYFILVLLLTSCKETKWDVFFNPINTVTFYVKTPDGIDLLNPEYSDFYSENKFRIAYLKDGKFQIMGFGNLDNKFGCFREHSGETYTASFLMDESADYTTTLVKWSETDCDTINCEWSFKGNTEILKVWVNGEIKWIKKEGIELQIPVIELIKEYPLYETTDEFASMN